MTIVTDCEGLHRRLKELVVCADQDRPFSGAISIEVLKRHGRYVIREGDEPPISSDNPEWVTLYVNEIIKFRLSHQLKDYVKIHAACGSFEGKRFLLVGEKGAGKTTLITRLLFDGVSAHGDEKVLLRGDEVIPLPRKFHLKEGTVPLVPRIAPVWEQKNSYLTSDGSRVCFFDPSDVGFQWQTKWGRVDTLFYLEPNHWKSTALDRWPKWLMAEKLIMQTLDFDANPETQIADLSRMATKSNAFLVCIGELEGAVIAIKEALSG